jgi:O-antigen/teichoic acid export membrane protein
LSSIDPTEPRILAAVEEAPFWRRARFWRRSVSASLVTWAATGITMLATLLAARSLGPGTYGSLVLALSLATLVGMLLDLTLDEAVVHLGYRSLRRGALGDLRELLRTALLIDVAFGLAVFAIIAVSAGPLVNLAGGDVEPGLVRLAGLGVLAATLDGTTTGVLLLAERPELRSWALLATGVLRIIGVLLALSLNGADGVLIAFAAATAMGGAFQGALAWRVGWRHWRSTSPTSWPGRRARELISFGFHTSVTTTVTGANKWLVPVLLGALAGPTTVGIFAVAYVPIVLANAATGPLRLSMFPEQVKLAANRRMEVLYRSILGYTRIGLAAGGAFALAGWFLLPSLIPALFGTSYESAVTPARVLLVGAVAQVAYGWAKTFPAAVGRPAIRTIVSLLEMAITIALLVLLTGDDADGAAIAVSTASLLMLGVWLGVARRQRSSTGYPTE